VHVLDERPEARLAVAAAHGEQRQLAVERDTFLEDVSGTVPGRLDQTLALSVVAEPRVFRSPGSSPPRRRSRRSDPEPSEELLLDQPVLSGLERCGTRIAAHAPGRLDRHVLELVRDDLGAVREPVEQLRSS
jgi:hypothetical protein